jgi:hypothetical protein
MSISAHPVALGKRSWIFLVLLGLIIYLPFQDVFVSFLAPYPPAQKIANYFVDLMVLLLFGLVAVWHLFRGRFVRTLLDLPLFLLGVSIFISIALNGRFNMDTLNNLLRFVRYIAVFYLTITLPISEKDLSTLFKVLGALGIILSILAIFLYLFPGLNKALENLLSSADRNELKIGGVRGTFSSQAEMAGFLLLTLIVYLGYFRYRPALINHIVMGIIIPAAFIFAIFATYKRAALIMAALVLGSYWLARNSGRRKIFVKITVLSLFLILTVLVLLLLIDLPSLVNKLSLYGGALKVRENQVAVSTFLLQLFSPEFWQRASSISRGWAIRVAAPRLLTSPYWLFGLSPDDAFMRLTLSQQYLEFAPLTRYAALKDVYWVTMLLYYGLCGLSVFFYILVKLYRMARRVALLSKNLIDKQLGRIFSIYIIIYILYGFIERLPELRFVSFLFWLLAGLVVNSYSRLLQFERHLVS